MTDWLTSEHSEEYLIATATEDEAGPVTPSKLSELKSIDEVIEQRREADPEFRAEYDNS